MVGVFAATDVFLFYVFFEAMLVPMYFIIGSFGGPRRQYAAVKFFLYSLVGGLIMLAASSACTWSATASSARARSPSTRCASSTSRRACRSCSSSASSSPSPSRRRWCRSTPGCPTPVPRRRSAARCCSSASWTRSARSASCATACRCSPTRRGTSRRWCWCWRSSAILYAALLAMGQSDMKRLVSYTSISHFGFIALGIFAFTTEAATGAVLYMVNHGIATGLLFVVVGMLIARGGSRQIRDYGGVAARRRCSAGAFLIAGLAVARPARHEQLRQRVPRADRLVHVAAGVHDRRDRRHHPGRALHPADVPAHDAGPAARRAAGVEEDAAGARSAAGGATAVDRRAPARRASLRVLDLDRRELAVVDPAGRADHRRWASTRSRC